MFKIQSRTQIKKTKENLAYYRNKQMHDKM